MLYSTAYANCKHNYGNHPDEQNGIYHIMSILRYNITIWKDIHSLPQSVFNLKSLHQHFNKTFRQLNFR